ncbi:site-specific DNA-methyltransferase [Myroides sp. BIT-d1]|uniref:Methyltransferase n=1 Tax=Myroides albus TaxID=2562892 RepID=A0A6I3LT30_9FLAO|nr:site-specific DNA-methyltransferase [Myroides albus]MTG99115.1 site-specific DNA-methyltransferase [Myroides albus]
MNQIFNHSSEKMSEIPDKSVDLMVTSPPYNINIDYGNKWVQGRKIEAKGKKYKDDLAEEQYREMLSNVIDETKRVLKDNGQIWINIKNRYDKGNIIPPFWIMEYFQDMYLKNIVIWNFDWGGSTSKRFCSRYEYVFFFTKKNEDYVFNLEDVKIPALNYRPDRYKSQLKNPSDVWKISLVSGNSPERTDHPAQYPEELIERIIKTGSNEGDLILDPFMGSGTTAVVSKKLKRNYVGYETEPSYIEIANNRLKDLDEKLF